MVLFRFIEQKKKVMGKLSVTSPIVINMQTIASLAVKTKGLFFSCG